MILVEARGALSKYVPQLTPKEPTVLLALPESPTTVAQYLGKIGNAHYIVSYFGSNSYEDNDATGLLTKLVVVHELVHQRQAEFLGQNRFWGFDYQGHIQNNPIFQSPQYSDQQAIETWVSSVNSKMNDIGHLGQNSSVLLYLYEGMAIAAEYMVLLQMVRHNDSPDLAKKIYKEYKANERRYQEDPDRQYGLEKYSRGIQMFRKLSSQLTTKELREFLQNIDIEKGLAIRHGSRRSIEIMRDPLLLPAVR